jgi:hypothetical protein
VNNHGGAEKPHSTLGRRSARDSASLNALIESFVGPDNKVLNGEGFISALVEGLRNAREQGYLDRSSELDSLL